MDYNEHRYEAGTWTHFWAGIMGMCVGIYLLPSSASLLDYFVAIGFVACAIIEFFRAFASSRGTKRANVLTQRVEGVTLTGFGICAITFASLYWANGVDQAFVLIAGGATLAAGLLQFVFPEPKS